MSSGEVTVLAASHGEPALLVRRAPSSGPSVIYVHGATFPSALSVAYRFDGQSWMDNLHDRGFDVWAFDFAGYGGSERPLAFTLSAAGQSPIGRAPEASRQLARVVDHVLASTGRSRVYLLAHSWGTLVAGLYATREPQKLDRLVLFGPIVRRDCPGAPQCPIEGWRLVSIADQLSRFVEDVPAGRAPVLIEPHLETWGPAYLATDPLSATRTPAAVQIPSGPWVDIADAWSGRFAYDPALIQARRWSCAASGTTFRMTPMPPG